MTRTFTGDYSTGDFGQWESVSTKDFIGAGLLYSGKSSSHSARITPLGDCGYAARYELRPGDFNAESGLLSERSESQAIGASQIALIGQTRWYAWSIKFDTSWPDQSQIGWMHIAQWRGSFTNTSQTVAIGWGQVGTPGYRPGHFYLQWNPQSAPGVSAPGVGLGTITPLVEMPLELGKWHDLKVRMTVSHNDQDGVIQLWRNGVPQVFRPTQGATLADNGTTFRGRTCTPTAPGNSFRQGIYRGPTPDFPANKTAIIWQTGVRIAETENSL